MPDTLNTSTSNTTCDELSGSWTLFPIVSLFSLVIGATLNLAVLSAFARYSSLRNSFGVYLINILVIDLTIAVIYSPLTLLEQYFPTWTFGYPACVFRWYLAWVFENIIIIAHLLIVLNRVWAVTFPFSYRTRHNTKLALLLCASSWAILNILYIPTAIATTVIVPAAVGNFTVQQCTLDTTAIGAWSPVSQLLLHDIPVLIVILSYPLVCYRSFFADRKPRIAPEAGTYRSTRIQRRDTPLVSGEGPTVDPENPSAKAKDKRVRLCGRIIQGSRTGFVTLTLMTLSVVVCLTPNEVYWTVVMMADIVVPESIFETVVVLQRITTICDPRRLSWVTANYAD